MFQEPVDIEVGLVPIEERGEEQWPLPSAHLDTVVEYESIGLLGYGQDVLVRDDHHRLPEQQVLRVEVGVETHPVVEHVHLPLQHDLLVQGAGDLFIEHCIILEVELVLVFLGYGQLLQVLEVTVV